MSRTFYRMMRRYRYLHGVFQTPSANRSTWQKLSFWLLADRFQSQARKLYGACIPVSCVIGEDVVFPHFWYGVHLGADAVIGPRTVVFHHVTVGTNEKGEAPVVGADAFLGAGAILVGRTRVGDGARIGANVTLTDVEIPPDTVIVNPSAYDITHGRPLYPQRMLALSAAVN